MSTVGEWIDLESRASGKWQIPVLAISLVLLTAATLRHRTTSRQATVADALAQLNSLQEAEQHDRVIQIGTRILERGLGTAAEQAAAQLAVARSRSNVVGTADKKDPAAAELIVDAFAKAQGGGATLDAGDLVRIAQAHEWSGRLDDAVRYFRRAIDGGPSDSARLRRHMFELLRRSAGGAVEERRALLDELLTSPSLGNDDRLWALTQKIYLLHEARNPEAAGELLRERESEFVGDQQWHAFAYLGALHLYLSGRLDDAELAGRALRNELEPWSPVYPRAGWLLGRVLLAKGSAKDAEAAGSFFNEVLLHHPRGEYAAAARIGIGEVMAGLGRHTEAVEAYADGLNMLPRDVDPNVVDSDELRVRLRILGETRRQEADFRTALEYSRLSLLLVDPRNQEQVAQALAQVAEVQFQLADHLRTRGLEPSNEQDGAGTPSSEEIRSLYSGAARTFLRLADLGKGDGHASDTNRWTAAEMARQASDLRDQAELEQTGLLLQQVAQSQAEFAAELEHSVADPEEAAGVRGDSKSLYAEAAATFVQLSDVLLWDDKRSAESLWKAAELYAKAGRTDKAIELFQTYAAQRPSDAMVPRALFSVGSLLEKAGRFGGAAEAYQDCFRRFPRTLDGARALLPLARCYLRIGSESEELAEKTLRLIVDDSEVFTPQAPEFSEALFLLGELLHRRGAYEGAVEALDEALARSPGHPLGWDARFLLADSYRQSGIRLKRELTAMRLTPKAEWTQTEFADRLRRARELYRAYVREFELRELAELSERERLGIRLASLYEADCLFEVQDYRAALQRYESIVQLMKDTSSALAASVQAINCHVFLGETSAAREALVRALQLVEQMPAEAFETRIAMRTRDDWRKYFQWLDGSGLF